MRCEGCSRGCDDMFSSPCDGKLVCPPCFLSQVKETIGISDEERTRMLEIYEKHCGKKR